MTRTLFIAAALLGSFAASSEGRACIQVLGITQDAGYPQVNCYKPHCKLAWEDSTAKRTASSIALIDEFDCAVKSRVLFIHMNHTNPLLVDGSPQQPDVEKRCFRFAREGMRLEL